MGNRKETQEKILQSARKEFMEKGYLGASLRNIVRQAGVTTGAFYGYYNSKEELFEALVKEPADELYAWYDRSHGDYVKKSAEEQINGMRQVTDDLIPEIVQYVYRYFDAFKLLFCHSAGTKYEHYMDRLVEVEAASTMEFIQMLEDAGYVLKFRPGEKLVHMISSQYFRALYEMVEHDMPLAEAAEHLRMLADFSYCGWMGMLGLHPAF